MKSNISIRTRFSGTGYSISKSTIEYVKKNVEQYLEDLVTSIIERHKIENEIRRQMGLPIRKIIRYENLYKPPLGLQIGEVGVSNRKTTLSTKGGIVE